MAGEEIILLVSVFGLPFLFFGMLLHKFVINVYGRTKLQNTLLKKNYGVAEIHTQSGKIFTQKIDLNELSFKRGEKAFTIDSSKAALKENLPVIVYRDDDAVAVGIDGKEEGGITPRNPKEGKRLESPEILQEQKRNIFSLLAAQLITDETKTIKLILILAAIAVGLGAINLVTGFNTGPEIQKCVSAIQAVNSSLGVVR